MTFYIIARYLIAPLQSGLSHCHKLETSARSSCARSMPSPPLPLTQRTHWYGNWKLELISQFSISHLPWNRWTGHCNRIQWPDQVFCNERNRNEHSTATKREEKKNTQNMNKSTKKKGKKKKKLTREPHEREFSHGSGRLISIETVEMALT